MWTSGWAPSTSFLEAQDGGRAVGMGCDGWIYTQSKPRLWRGDGRHVGARAPPAWPTRLACSVAAGGDKGTPGNPAKGRGGSQNPTVAPGAACPGCEFVQLTEARGAAASVRGVPGPGAVGPRWAQQCGGADQGPGVRLLTRRRP